MLTCDMGRRCDDRPNPDLVKGVTASSYIPRDLHVLCCERPGLVSVPATVNRLYLTTLAGQKIRREQSRLGARKVTKDGFTP